MKKQLISLLLGIFFVQFSHAVDYPKAKQGQTTDNYFGTTVKDPYRELEDLNNPETKKWITKEQKLTSQYFSGLKQRAAIKQRLSDLWTYELHGVPVHKGEYYFYTIDDGKTKFPILYKTKNLFEKPSILVDPNQFSKDGNKSLIEFIFTRDGKQIAYSVGISGSDWREWHFKNVETGEESGDVLRGMKWQTPAWNKAGTGVFYCRYPDLVPTEKSSGENEKIYYHRIGQDQKNDELVFNSGDSKVGTNISVSDDGRWLILNTYKSSDGKSNVYVSDISKINLESAESIKLLKFSKPFGNFEALNWYIDSNGAKGYFFSRYNAPNGRVIEVNLEKPSLKQAKILIPEGRDAIDNVTFVGHRFFVVSLENGKSKVDIYEENGRPIGPIQLPSVGTVIGLGGLANDAETFFSFQNFFIPRSIFKVDVKTGATELVFQPKVTFQPNDFVTEEVMYPSKDGVSVPMFVTHKKNIELNGNNPTWLYAYGAYGDTETPYFQEKDIVWMENGGVSAVVNVRGGGVYGEKWHEAGYRQNKQKSFDDFISAAEWLIKKQYTSPGYLVANGGSLGGLLAGAVLTQKPDLFAGVIVDVGLLDALRYHKFTGAYLWVDELGSSDDAQQFKNLYAYSPLHNIKPNVSYPSVLISTGFKDTRVIPGHSFKFTAALQSATVGKAPILLRVEPNGGHKFRDLSKDRKIELLSDKISFALDATSKGK